MDTINTVVLVAISIVLIWFGSGLIVNTVLEIAGKLKISPFIISFVLLGMLTSTTEMSVAFNSYIDKTPEIAVGNLLGGIIVLFLLMIPLLAIIGNGIKIENQYTKISLLLTLGTLVFPAIFFLDSYLQYREALFLLICYGVSIVILFIGNKHKKRKTVNRKIGFVTIIWNFCKIILGTILLLWACDNLIKEVINVANSFNVSPFIISFLTLSIGTNLPEMSLAIKSILKGDKEVAFGDYLGSASFNLVILAVLALFNNRISINANFISIIVFTVLGLGLFYYFALSKREISRKEGIILLTIYFAFICFEIFIK
jgi:cation:H+ antiporter